MSGRPLYLAVLLSNIYVSSLWNETCSFILLEEIRIFESVNNNENRIVPVELQYTIQSNINFYNLRVTKASNRVCQAFFLVLLLLFCRCMINPPATDLKVTTIHSGPTRWSYSTYFIPARCPFEKYAYMPIV